MTKANPNKSIINEKRDQDYCLALPLIAPAFSQILAGVLGKSYTGI